MAKYTDLSYLKEITGGDPGIVKEMIEMFIEQVDEFNENLSNFLENKEWIKLGKEAHKAKSSVLIVGMEEMGKQLKKLQLLTEEGKDIETYPEYVEKFKHDCGEGVKELQEELKNL